MSEVQTVRRGVTPRSRPPAVRARRSGEFHVLGAGPVGCSFSEEPDSPLGFVDPVLEQAGRGNVAVLKGANIRCFLTPRAGIHAAPRRDDLDVSPPSVPCPPTFQSAADR